MTVQTPTVDDELARTPKRPEWQELRPLGPDLPPVSAFDPQFLPESFRPVVDDVSERMQTPPDFAAASTIVSLAGCVNRRAMVQPKKHDASWKKACNIWGGIVGRPGVMKSPVLETTTRPLKTTEGVWRKEFEAESAKYELEREEAELSLQAWREQVKAAKKKGDTTIPPRPSVPSASPTQKRLLLQDATFEKLHEILAENPAGILVLRDELTGFLSQLDRQGREGERAFYLSAWNGNDGHSIDRIGRGSIYVDACCVSLFGGIQPGRLRTYLQDALQDGPANDGLMQRFQVIVWPDPPKTWELVDRAPNTKAEEDARIVYAKLAALPVDEPRTLKFEPNAQELFNAWFSELESKIRSDELHPALVAHLAKYRSLMPVLAALYELADWAAGLDGGEAISLAHAQQSAAFCEYLESHAKRIYSCIVSPEMRGARELSRHISRGDLRTRFKMRELYRHDWSGLSTPSQARSAVEILEDAGWVRPAPQKPETGRPSEIFDINPEVLKK